MFLSLLLFVLVVQGPYHWSEAEKDTVSPIGVEIYDTGVEPLVHEMPLNPEGFLCLDYDTLKRK